MRSAVAVVSAVVIAACTSFAGGAAPADASDPAPGGEGPQGPDAASPIGDASSDAGAADAGAAAWVPCEKRREPAIFCADFDDGPGSLVYENGVPRDVPAPPLDVTFARQPPSVSPPNALWTQSSGPTFAIDFLPPTPANISVIEASLSVRFAQVPAQMPKRDFFTFGVRDLDGATGGCQVSLALTPKTDQRIVMTSRCGNPFLEQTRVLLPNVPSSVAFVALKVQLDMGTGIVQATVGSAFVTMDVGFKSMPSGAPAVEIGSSDPPTLSGPEIAYDDILVVGR